MEDINIIVEQLPDYVEQRRDVVLREIVLGGSTVKHMVPQTGIKTSAAINYLDVDPVFQDGSQCKFTPQEGGIELTQRQINTGLIKVNLEICPKTVLGKYAEYLVSIKATAEDFPFEEFILADIILKINAKLEKAIWQGDTTSANPDLNKFDGLLKLAGEEDDTVVVNFTAAMSAWDKIKAVIKALPEEAASMDRVSVFVSPELYLDFILELVEKNLFHYSGPQNEAPEEITFPGTNINIVKTLGLKGTGAIYATFDRNLYYGCDLQNAQEVIKVWFSDDDDVIKVKVLWNSGVQTAYPDLVVVGSLGSGPAPDPDPETVTIYGPDTLSMSGEGYVNNEGAVEIPEQGMGVIYSASNGSQVTATVKDAGTLVNPTVRVVGGNIVIVLADPYEYVEGGGLAKSGTITIAAGDATKDVTVSQAMLPQGA